MQQLAILQTRGHTTDRSLSLAELQSSVACVLHVLDCRTCPSHLLVLCMLVLGFPNNGWYIKDHIALQFKQGNAALHPNHVLHSNVFDKSLLR